MFTPFFSHQNNFTGQNEKTAGSNEVDVVEMMIEMELIARKRKELLLTIRDILSSTRVQTGCQTCFACLDMENNKILNMTICWESQLHLDEYRESKLFQALLGAIRLLCKSYKITFKEIIALNRTVNP